MVSCGATRVTDNMLIAASRALATASPLANTGEGALLPPLQAIKSLSVDIAFAVATQAIKDGVAPIRTPEEIIE